MFPRINSSITDQLLAVTQQQRSAVAGTPAELALRARERQITNAAGHAAFVASAPARRARAEQARHSADTAHRSLVRETSLDFYELEAYLDGVVEATAMASISDRFYNIASREEKGRVPAAEWESLAADIAPLLARARSLEVCDPYSLMYVMGDAAGLPTVHIL